MKKLFIIYLILIFTGQTYAQVKDITGVIRDSVASPVKNARLSVIDTRITARSNKKGEFTVKKVRSDDSVQVVIGKNRAATFPIGNGTRFSLTVTDQTMNIESDAGDIHIASYYEPLSPKKTGTVITAKMIERNDFSSLTHALKTLMPFISFSIDENGNTVASMRGKTSLTLSNAALVLVDGVEIPYSDAENSVSVWDIERVEANKDGLGYGVKGANGVLVITTK